MLRILINKIKYTINYVLLYHFSLRITKFSSVERYTPHWDEWAIGLELIHTFHESRDLVKNKDDQTYLSGFLFFPLFCHVYKSSESRPGPLLIQYCFHIVVELQFLTASPSASVVPGMTSQRDGRVTDSLPWNVYI